MDAATVLTDIQLASQALWRAGVAGGIEKFDGGDLQEKVAAAYWPLTDAALTLTTWRFNTVTRKLSQLASPPPSRWAYRYTLPGDRLGEPYAIFFDQDKTAGTQNFEIFEDELWCDEPIAFALYQRRPTSPGKWSPIFRDFVMTDLAAVLALDINQDRSRYQTLKIEAYGSLDANAFGGKLALAVQREAMTLPPVQALPDGGPLVRARLGGD
ncbi:hypothetical protein [Maricaulis sp.]|uniref:hypothetical protein n=1 Tax=Maricaulis sp. TaxID=1486257 RepID=UPI00329886AF